MSLSPLPHWQELGAQASYFHRSGLSSRGIDLMKEAIELIRPERGLADQVASKLNYLAHMYLAVGRPAEAEAAIREAMEYDGDRGDQVRATNLMVLALVLHQQGRQKEAIRTGKQALRLYRKALGWGNDLYRKYKQMVADLKKPPVPQPAQPEQVGRGAA
jgi:tetratricopeptide (TPR) repeat protein